MKKKKNCRGFACMSKERLHEISIQGVTALNASGKGNWFDRKKSKKALKARRIKLGY